MLSAFWKQLKSGTDIRGVASDEVESEKINLTDEVIKDIILGFSTFISEKTNKKLKDIKIAVGHDSRISAGRIKEAVITTLVSAGSFVYDCSLSSTPAMFMTTVDLNCDASIEITASHHPFNRNGLKFFTKDGGLDSKDIEKILLYAQDKKFPEIGIDKGIRKPYDYMPKYAGHLRELIKKEVAAANYDLPLSGFKIVVDASNGAGGFYANTVLKPLGADIGGSQFLEPDGMFPNHVPNPENPKAMESISKAVLKEKADIGVIFDTDVDRGAAVDCYGEEISRNNLVAIASLIALEGNTGATIVTDSITSDGLTYFIENELGAKHRRFKRGYKNVINEAIRLNQEGINCPLAIETSGHAALRENYFLDDGAYLVTKIIIKAVKLKREGKNLHDILCKLPKPKESIEVRIPIKEDDFKALGDKVIEEIKQSAAESKGLSLSKDNFEGARINIDREHGDGWFLIRLSVHDPMMPLNVESNEEGGVKKILKIVYNILSGNKGLDLESLCKAIADE